MDKFTKKQILVAGLIFLIVINLAALATFLYQNYKSEQEIPPPPVERFRQNRPHHDFRSSHHDRFEPFIKNRLNLDKKQFNTFKDLRQKSLQEQVQIRENIRIKTDEMMKELASDKPDRKQLKSINKEIGQLHMKLNQITIDHFIEMKDQLDEKQRAELNKLIENMSEHRRHQMRGKNRNNYQKN